MANTALVVHLDIEPEKFDEFVDLARAHGARSVEIEEGCLRFEVMVPEDDPHHVILIELYSDRAALQSHWESAHMAEYLDRVSDMIVSRRRYLCSV